MAVVFISPKQRQKMFIIGITVGVGLFCAVIAVIVLFSQPKEVSSGLVFNKPKVNINFEILNSDQFTSLVAFEGMKIQFSYKATKNDEPNDGYISATSEAEAKEILEDLGYNVSEIKEAEIGRQNPFESYTIPAQTDLQALLEGAQTETIQTGE